MGFSCRTIMSGFYGEVEVRCHIVYSISNGLDPGVGGMERVLRLIPHSELLFESPHMITENPNCHTLKSTNPAYSANVSFYWLNWKPHLSPGFLAKDPYISIFQVRWSSCCQGTLTPIMVSLIPRITGAGDCRGSYPPDITWRNFNNSATLK